MRASINLILPSILYQGLFPVEVLKAPNKKPKQASPTLLQSV